jgi:hypothetical protein
MSEIYSPGEFKLWEGESVGETGIDISTIALIKKGASTLSSAFKPKIVNVLTNKRALVVQRQGNEERVIWECVLERATVSVLNRTKELRNLGSSFRRATSGRAVNRDISLGDVVFFSNGRVGMKFQRVEDPDGVRNVAEKAIAGVQGAKRVA